MTLPDLQKYRDFMSEFEMTDEEKDEVTLALWTIMNHFIDDAFGEHSVQLCKKAAKTIT